MPVECPDALSRALGGVRERMHAAAAARAATPAMQPLQPPTPRLLAVSKAQPAAAIRALAQRGQRAFGENYLQEALAKQAELAHGDPALPPLEWHFIGRLQSNKCAQVARCFQWVQSVDRLRVAEALSAAHQPGTPLLQVLVQVNIDQEAAKGGCTPADTLALAAAVAKLPGLRLRGLMAIPPPAATEAAQRASFRAMRALFEQLREAHPAAHDAMPRQQPGQDAAGGGAGPNTTGPNSTGSNDASSNDASSSDASSSDAGPDDAGPKVDTLSMGMSADFAVAIEEGATLVRVGTALFGARPV